MSLLCPASLGIISLRDGDLPSFQSQWNQNHGRDKNGPKGAVDIQLECKVTIASELEVNARLDILDWKRGTTALCGSCAFCRLLLEGLERTLHPKSRDWDLGSGSSNAEIPTFLVVNIDLNTWQYYREKTRWDKGNWNPYSIALGGHAGAVSGSSDLPRDLSSINFDIEVAFELFAEENDPIANLLKIHRRPLDTSTLSEANVVKIHSWIEDCDAHHGRCWSDFKPSTTGTILRTHTEFLPTRLLDVAADRHPRLVLTSNFTFEETESLRGIKYIALSYCWGLAEDAAYLLRTTHSTMAARLQGIKIDAMPQAFRDAITVARLLEIQYIWIDSLCIIQDDVLDWQTESSRMADIFSSAYLTVIAAKGASCQDSFLHRDAPKSQCDVPIRFNKLDIEGQFSLRYRRRIGTDKMSEISGSRWLTRGWAFQEERLARRVLIFGENKFFFDCRTLERSEGTEVHSLRPKWVNTIYRVARPEEGGSELVVSGEDNRSRALSIEHWHTLCGHYSYRDLTFPEDKLPAISGIANRFSKKLQSDYLAGLWRDHLTHDLFWQSTGNSTRPEKYRAPSWSWASLDGRILWPSWWACSMKDCLLHCTILDVQTEILGVDPFGAVRGGFLKVLGTVLKVELSPQPSDALERRFTWRCCFDGTDVGMAKLDIEDAQSSPEDDCWVLLIVACPDHKSRKLDHRGLVLQKAGGDQGGMDEFKRLGVFRVPPESAMHRGRDDPLRVWNEAEKRTIVVV